MLKYALIGCGRISYRHIEAAIKSNLKIVALCDININKAHKLKEKYNIDDEVCVYSDYTKMINCQELDLVSIATPSGTHAEIAIMCCENSINVIIEKPIALSMHDAYRIKEVASVYGCHVTVCHQNRFNEAVKCAAETVFSGKIGKIYSINANVLWNRGRAYYEQASWRGTWSQDGGVLMNQGIHNIDLLRWIADSNVGSVAAIIANEAHPYIEVEDIGVAIIRFNNGCIGTINCTSNVYPSNLEETLYIIGENGTIKLGGKSVNQMEVYAVDGVYNADDLITQISSNPPNEYGYGHDLLFRDFVDSILYGKAQSITIDDAIMSLELVLGIYKSALEKGFIYFPLNDFSTDEMGEEYYGI